MENDIISWLREKQLTQEETFHLLRHFSRISTEATSRLLGSGLYSNEDIEIRLRGSGSKFNPLFAESPEALLNRVRLLLDTEGSVQVIRESPERFHIICRVSEDMEVGEAGIGSDNLLSIDELSPEERSGLKISGSRQNPWIDILEIRRDNLRSTNRFHIIIIKNDEGFRLATIFPGTYAPPFPDKEFQDEEGFEASFAFWKTHVFIV